MELDHSMNNGYISPLDIEDYNFSCPERRIASVQEQDVASIESRLHASTQYDNNLYNMKAFTWVLLSEFKFRWKII